MLLIHMQLVAKMQDSMAHLAPLGRLILQDITLMCMFMRRQQQSEISAAMDDLGIETADGPVGLRVQMGKHFVCCIWESHPRHTSMPVRFQLSALMLNVQPALTCKLQLLLLPHEQRAAHLRQIICLRGFGLSSMHLLPGNHCWPARPVEMQQAGWPSQAQYLQPTLC